MGATHAAASKMTSAAATKTAPGKHRRSDRHRRSECGRDEAREKPVLHRKILLASRRDFAARQGPDEVMGELPSTYKCARF
jgi:hypothetical protein